MKVKLSRDDSVISSDVSRAHLCIYFAFIKIEMLMVREPSLLSCSPSFCLPQLLLSWDGLCDDLF